MWYLLASTFLDNLEKGQTEWGTRWRSPVTLQTANQL